MESRKELEAKLSELKAEYAKQTVSSESNKLIANSTFGKTASPYSVLYDPQLLLQITLCGQLYLLMLIEALEKSGVPVVSANTDGLVMCCPKTLRKKMIGAITKWERATGFVTEETQYRSYHARDVNAYLAIKLDGSVKGKNVFYDPWRAGAGARELYWRFQKNCSAQICVEAVERFLVDGVPLAETIGACRDITRFVAIKNVTGGAHRNGDYLGRVVRWYYARGETGTINYVTNGRIVADTEGARPIMDLPAAFPDDVDVDWYVRRAETMLRDCGYNATPTLSD